MKINKRKKPAYLKWKDGQITAEGSDDAES